MSERPQRILTVSELTLLVRERLEQGFSEIWVEGEVSNLRTPSSGHLYFTLKDASSQLRVVLFRSSAQRLRFSVKEGLQVIVRGRLTVYEPRGEYQAVLEYVEPKGIGALQLAFEQLKEKLAREGLFDRSRKRPLPLLPRCVGLVTSLSGAAILDMLTVLRRRCPRLAILIMPTPVQGESAAPLIAEAIRTLGTSGKVDVIIVGRGGGSWEDLWCFNEEIVVRAIAESIVPVVSAVGHEIDYTLADLAADCRAPTPSAAAETVAPVFDVLIGGLQDLRGRSERAMRTKIALLRQAARASDRARPVLMLQAQRAAQKLDEYTGLLGQSLRGLLTRLQRRREACRHAVLASSPLVRVRNALMLAPQLLKRLERQMRAALAARRQAVRSLAFALDNLSPLAVLARGYSIIQRIPDQAVVRRAKDVSVGDEVRARLGEGQLLCGVRKILSD